MKIFVASLPYNATTEQLKALFENYGLVHHARIVTDHAGQSRGFGFIGMPWEGARVAIAELDQSVFCGRTIVVREALNQKKFDPELSTK